METSVELIKVETFKQIIETAPDSLTKNELSVNKALDFGSAILTKLVTEGMSDDLDKEMNDYQVKLKKTYDLMNERRTPITRLFDDVKKAFTSLEAKVDSKGKDNIYFQIQSERNKWATKKATEAAAKARENERKLAVEKERIEAQTQIESQLQLYFNNYLSGTKITMNNEFEAVTLETLNEFQGKLERYTPTYSFAHFEAFKPQLFTNYLTASDLANIITNLKVGKFEKYSMDFKEQITELKTSLIEKLPSKYRELQQIANANDVEAQMLRNEAESRKQIEENRLKDEAAAANNKAIADAQVNKDVMTANTLFDMQGPATIETPSQVREGYEIEVLHPSGWQQIFQMYFTNEGMKETNEVLSKKSLGQMKTFCEKWAKDKEEKITSPYLKYKETYKTVAKKVVYER